MNHPKFIVSYQKEESIGYKGVNNHVCSIAAVASAIRTSLGPRGMDKMVINLYMSCDM